MFTYFKIRRLIKSIRDAHWESSTENAVDGLAAIGPPAIQPLLRLLASDSSGFRGRAGERALAKMGRPAVPALIAKLHDRDYEARGNLALALGEIRDPRGFDPLIQALGDPNRTLRWQAAEALGKFGDARAIGALLGASNDADEYVRASAVEAVGRLARGQNADARVVDALVRALADKSDSVRRNAIAALGDCASSAKVVEVLIASLKDQRGNERWALEALAKHPDPRAIGTLASLVREGNPAAEEAVKQLRTILRSAIARVATQDLRTVAALKEITVVVEWMDLACTREEGIRSAPSRWANLGVTELVQMARQELVRRSEAA